MMGEWGNISSQVYCHPVYTPHIRTDEYSPIFIIHKELSEVTLSHIEIFKGPRPRHPHLKFSFRSVEQRKLFVRYEKSSAPTICHFTLCRWQSWTISHRITTKRQKHHKLCLLFTTRSEHHISEITKSLQQRYFMVFLFEIRFWSRCSGLL